MSTKKTTFAEDVLSEMNKSNEQIQEERIVDIVEDYILEIGSQIAILNSDIPIAEKLVERAKRDLEKAEDALENQYLKLQNGNFEKYIQGILNAENTIREKEEKVSFQESQVENLKAQAKKYKSLLKRLS